MTCFYISRIVRLQRSIAKSSDLTEDFGEEPASQLDPISPAASGSPALRSACLAPILADAYGRVGEFDRAFTVLEQWLTIRSKYPIAAADKIYCRLRGELLLRTGSLDEAEKSLRSAIELSAGQGAKMEQLRSTAALARLLAKQGRLDEARVILAEIYNWFTEGFDTADLKDAKALLDELAG